MKKAIITGAAGFAGCHLTESLTDKGYKVYAVVRPGSEHNDRIKGFENVTCVEVNIESNNCDLSRLPENFDYFFHLAWKPADRYDYPAQMESAYLTLEMLENAAKLGCRRFIGIGSQAEYGAADDLTKEDDTPLRPFCGYGAAKTAACYMTKMRAKKLGIEWVWGRIFSVYGRYEPDGRLLPYLIKAFVKGEDVKLSSCRQNWDFLNGSDAGKALAAMAEHGRDGEIYNIAYGGYRPLRDFVEETARICGYKGRLTYGKDPEPFVSLQPSVDKLKRDTGWAPEVSFETGIKELLR